VGWIGLNRLRAIAEEGGAEIVGIVDALPAAAHAAISCIEQHARNACVVGDFDELLTQDLDGIVIATPSGLHAAQATAALQRGTAVFCQKPLARTASEAGRVISAARDSDKLLSVDFCYRTVTGVPQLVDLARGGELGEIYAADLVFHNAYGPDKAWFYDRQQSGGGCVMDLGIHLLDLALLVLDYPRVRSVTSQLHAAGKLLAKPVDELEDHAFAEVQFNTGATVRIACSWRLSAGQDAVIEAAFYGTRGAVILHNLEGSFYNFAVEHCVGTARHTVAMGDNRWGGRAANAWVHELSQGARFDARANRFYDLSVLIDAIYGRTAEEQPCEY
ncbi:MAG: Gfo/Idh/MocA family oxidoreductase, partial [Sinobacteraceae bacterium]|nr:Gfo/Idh/MocA family oxidoreductase [Nevskiaceae bacterium]